jgi:hypothetical protein
MTGQPRPNPDFFQFPAYNDSLQGSCKQSRFLPEEFHKFRKQFDRYFYLLLEPFDRVTDQAKKSKQRHYKPKSHPLDIGVIGASKKHVAVEQVNSSKATVTS